MTAPEIPLVHAAPGERTSPRFAEAFAAGCGGAVATNFIGHGGRDWAGFGSPRTWDSLTQARKAGRTFYYGDHAYFRAGRFYRVTRNAFQLTARDFGAEPVDFRGMKARAEGLRRLDALGVDLAPWRRDGAHVLVCPPDDAIGRLMGFDPAAWQADVLGRLRAHTDRPLRIRDRRAAKPLARDLAGAWALVTWTSNAAVEAVCAGVPVFCTGDCAAAVMGRTDPVNIEYPVYPDGRRDWAAKLAANQWTLDEIAAGDAWWALNKETVS